MLHGWLRRSRCHCRRHYSSAENGPLLKQQCQVIFSGIQPTGIPHLGNYLGALRNWVSFQSVFPSTASIYYSIVDLHAITIPYDRNILRKDRDEMWYVLYAVGVDMQRCTVFDQSAVVQRLNHVNESRFLNMLN
jgi:tryptophanyl-tRNA synthetase